MNRLVLETEKNLLEAEDFWCPGKESGHKRPPGNSAAEKV
jgi:hypothetical protein